MMSLVIHNKILPEARLPFERIKGNVKTRYKKADIMFKKFYNELAPKLKQNSCPVETFRQSLDKILEPNKINYEIVRETRKEAKGSLGPIVGVETNPKGEYTALYLGHRFYLPLNECETEIPDKYTLFHETRHFFDHLCSPKTTISRANKLINVPKQLEEKVDKLRESFLRNLNKPTNIFKLVTDSNKRINEIPTGLAIDTLQRIRYCLMGEIKAYGDEKRCVLKDKKYSEYIEYNLLLLQNCQFKAKLIYVNAKLKQLIQAERELNRKKCENKKCN